MKQPYLTKAFLAAAWTAVACAPGYAQPTGRTAPLPSPAAQALQLAPPKAMASNTNNLVVSAPTSLSANNEIGTYGSPVLLKAKLSSPSAGPSLANLSVAFKVDGIDVGTGMTDGGGTAQCSFSTLPGGYVIGSHKISAHFAGNGVFAKSNADATLSVLKATTKIEGTNSGMVVYATKDSNGASVKEIFVEGKLVRTTDNTPLDGRSIDITLNGAVIGNTATTGSGRFSYKAPFNKGPGQYALQAVFDTDSHYLGTASAKKDIELSAAKVLTGFATSPTVQPALPVYFVGQQITVSTKVALLPGGYGPGVAGVTVWIRPDADQPVFKVVTNAAGIASATFKLMHAGNAQQLGAEITDNNYIDANKSGVWSTVKVIAAPLSVKVEGPSSGKVGDLVDLKVSLTNAVHADDPVAGFFKLSVLGTPVGKGTNKIAIPASLGIGNKAIKVVFAGDNSYGPSEGVWNIHIQPKDN